MSGDMKLDISISDLHMAEFSPYKEVYSAHSSYQYIMSTGLHTKQIHCQYGQKVQKYSLLGIRMTHT